MKLGLISQSISFATVPLAIAIATAGCSGTPSTQGGLLGPPGSNNNNGADGGANPPPPAPPHALATIVLGESHPAGQSSSSALVAASFIPDAAQLSNCTTSIGGCTLAARATCDGNTGPLCTSEQICTLDASCKPTCQATCTVQCPSGQECYFATPSTQSCRPTQSFDAGDLVFSGPGLASAITLFPPDYTFTNSSMGNPIVPGGQIQVTGAGATGAGFAPFQETFKATTLLQTVPSLSKLTAANVYSSSGLALGWQPGGDSILISVTGPKGSAQCPASDSSGKFSVPPAVISAVAGLGSPAITISVTRQRVEEKTDGKTEGTLAGATVQPVGYLDLTTVSSETYTVQGCGSSSGTGGGLTMCTDGCVDLLTSSTDCGACGHSCGTGYCESGVCYGTTGSCTNPYTSCSGVCVNLATSASNCGSCGYSCPSGEYCVSGTCSTSSSCGSLTSCADGCRDLMTSSTDCGSCGNSCDGGTCSSGVCSSSTTCASCETSAESGTCSSQYSACTGDANCSNYSSCMSGCSAGDTTCQSTCQLDYSTGATEARNLQSCLCQTACSSSCGTSTYCTQTL